MAEKHNLSVRRLRKSINFGRLATEEEVQGDPADRGHVTYSRCSTACVVGGRVKPARHPSRTGTRTVAQGSRKTSS